MDETVSPSNFQRDSTVALVALQYLPTTRLAQNHLVVRLLDECVSRLKLSTIISTIFENPLTFYTRLKDTEYEHCALALLEYLKERDKTVPITIGGPDFYDEKLIGLINLLFYNYPLLDRLPNWLNNTNLTDFSILEAFDLLKHIVEQRFYRSAIIEVKKEKEMHKIYAENMILRKEIDYMKWKLRTQKQRSRWRRVLRSGGVFKYQDELTARKWNQYKQVSRVILENGQRIKALQFGYANKINQLEEEVQHLKNEYAKLRIVNEKEMKRVLEEKNKWLIQLQSSIEKHDRVLCEKIKENLYLQEEYDKQREEFDAYMIGYSAIEKEYNEIVAAEKAERDRIWRKKAELFFLTRAALIIQRYYRNYIKQKQALMMPRASKAATMPRASKADPDTKKQKKKK